MSKKHENQAGPGVKTTIREIGPGKWHVDVSGKVRGEFRRKKQTVWGTREDATARGREIAFALQSADNPSSARTLGDVYEHHATHYAPAHNLAPATVKGYRVAFDLYLAPFFGKMAVAQIDAFTIQRFTASLLGDGYAPGNVNRQLEHLQALLRYACDTLGWIPTVPPIKRLRAQTQRHTWSADDITAITETAAIMLRNDQPSEIIAAAIVLLGLHCGLRVGEICALQAANVHPTPSPAFPNGHVIVANSGDAHSPTKSRKARHVPLTALCARALQAAIAVSTVNGYALGRVGGGRLTPAMCTHALTRVLRAAGLSREGLRLAGMHSLRHAYATYLSERNLPIPALSRLLGHASAKTTMVYLHGIGTGGEIARQVSAVFDGADGASGGVGAPIVPPGEKPSKPAARRLKIVR